MKTAVKAASHRQGWRGGERRIGGDQRVIRAVKSLCVIHQ